MEKIVVGSRVQCPGERFLRKVTEVRGERVRCERMPSGDAQWFALADLRLEPSAAPMKPYVV